MTAERWRPLGEVLDEMAASGCFHTLPLEARVSYQRLIRWLPHRERSLTLQDVTASFARVLRDRVARELGWRNGNRMLSLIQLVIARAVQSGELQKDRVRNVPKLPPTRPPNYRLRRRIPSLREALNRSRQPDNEDSIRERH